MVVNLTSTPSMRFSTWQKEALRPNLPIIDMCHVRDLDLIEDWFSREKPVSLDYVLVDKSDFVFANDVANLVACPVRTLGVTIAFDPERNVYFSELDYDEDC